METKKTPKIGKFPAKIFIGKRENENIYLSAPSWDCGWYWGFGYLGNKNCHYHVNGLAKKENTNLAYAFKKHFGKSLIVRSSQLWVLCDLFGAFYTLKDAAKVLAKGGSHYTTNPCEEIIKNKEEVTRINFVVLPKIFEEIYKILIPAQENDKVNKTLLEIILEGDTNKVVDFMFENKITTDDLEEIDGVTNHDFNVIHSYYWKRFHNK